MFSSKITERLSKSKNIFWLGIGGGSDIFAAMPMYYRYYQKSILANVTWCNVEDLEKLKYDNPLFQESKETVWKLDHTQNTDHIPKTFPGNYLPELWLSKELKRDVYAIRRGGVQQLKKSLELIIEKENQENEAKIDTIVLVDGGVDALMFGDEQDIGSFEEDFASIVAVSLIDNTPDPIQKLLVNNCWGLEGCVSHFRFFENISTLQRQNGFLGAQALELR